MSSTQRIEPLIAKDFWRERCWELNSREEYIGETSAAVPQSLSQLRRFVSSAYLLRVSSLLPCLLASLPQTQRGTPLSPFRTTPLSLRKSLPNCSKKSWSRIKFWIYFQVSKFLHKPHANIFHSSIDWAWFSSVLKLPFDGAAMCAFSSESIFS